MGRKINYIFKVQKIFFFHFPYLSLLFDLPLKMKNLKCIPIRASLKGCNDDDLC